MKKDEEEVGLVDFLKRAPKHSSQEYDSSGCLGAPETAKPLARPS